ncbi:MAG TPA: hypothetical protein VG986_04840 [Pseudolabrys sp.]|nr:hypothetical protein [Pseudolabrys sp.]
MTRLACTTPQIRRRAVFCSVVAACFLSAALAPAMAASGPFHDFSGTWSGTGTIRQSNGSTERIRCAANYRTRGSTGHEVDLNLRCTSDTYNFDLVGQFQADGSNTVTGRWSERSRNIGGSAIGRARGDSLQVHAESSGFAANLAMVTRGRRQSVTLNSQGGGQTTSASIVLRRN